jgi:secretion/DNA translocation related CpaE-like protein
VPAVMDQHRRTFSTGCSTGVYQQPAVPHAQRMHQATLVTEQSELLDDILRLAAAAGVEVHVVSHAEAARLHWQPSALMLIDATHAGQVARLGLPRRPGVLIVTREPGMPDRIWPDALAVGAEHVVALPEGERWLANRLQELHDGPSRHGRIVTVMGAGGGAGASTLAAGLARVANAAGQRVLLVDADPLSAGIDLVLGADDATGGRWSDVLGISGRINPNVLRDALPNLDGITILGPARQTSVELNPAAFTQVLEAGIRGFDLIVVDLPCAISAINACALSKASSALLIAPAHVLATCRAVVVVEYIKQHTTALQFIVRQVRDGLDPSVVAEAVRVPLAHTMSDRSRVFEAANTADPPDIDDVYAKSCQAILNHEQQGVAA